MDIETRMNLIMRPPAEETLTRSDLRNLLQTKSQPVAYNGFEPSGLAHLGTGLITALKVKDLTEAGCKFILFLADWHAWVNGKLGGDIEKIRKCADYLKEVWRSLGVDESKVNYVLGTDVYNQDYWNKVIKVASSMTFNRATRALTIAGKSGLDEYLMVESGRELVRSKNNVRCPLCDQEYPVHGDENLEGYLNAKAAHVLARMPNNEPPRTATFFYTPMQVADIFHLGVDICQLGIDQRKANILAREVGPKLGYWSPVCVHHHLLMGLQGPKKMGFEEDEKLDEEIAGAMHKSVKGSSIYVHDSPEVIAEKLHKAYCPEKNHMNPVMEIIQYLLMRDERTPFIVTTKNGEVTYDRYDDVEQAYDKGAIHPLDLKKSTADGLAKLLEPCRRHFTSDKRARELLEFVKRETE